MSSYSHQYFLKKYIMPFNSTINFWKRTSCLIFPPFFWNWYSMSKFCFIFPPVFLKKVHHAKLIRIGFLRLRTPCLLFAPCFFKGEHGVLYSHHLKGIKYSSIAIRTSACIRQWRVLFVRKKITATLKYDYDICGKKNMHFPCFVRFQFFQNSKCCLKYDISRD